MELNRLTITNFQEAVWDYYRLHGRHHLLWRLPDANGLFDPYSIMVSEVMLQQTQFSRVTSKYQEFLAQFPNPRALAAADLGQVLRVWSGLGYNRRAKFLHLAAQQIVGQKAGSFPETVAGLVALPGIGINTAGAIMAYAYNQPVVFLETNIRTVYIHYFFDDQTAISDKALTELVTQTLDSEHPREWYWALMDYGHYLKRTVGNLSRQSKGYAKQSTFQGSKRQIRGQVLRELNTKPLTYPQLEKIIIDARLGGVLNELLAEGLITKHGSKFSL